MGDGRLWISYLFFHGVDVDLPVTAGESERRDIVAEMTGNDSSICIGCVPIIVLARVRKRERQIGWSTFDMAQEPEATRITTAISASRTSGASQVTMLRVANDTETDIVKLMERFGVDAASSHSMTRIESERR